MESWPAQKLRSAYKKRLALIGLTVLVLLLVLASRFRYWDNFVNGPYEMANEELSALRNADDLARYFVRVEGRDAAETGMQEIRIKKSGGREVDRGVTAIYYALAAGEKILLVKIEAGMPLSVAGALEPMPVEVGNELYGMLARQPKTTEDGEEYERITMKDFYPFYLDATYSRVPGIAGLAVAGAFFVILAVMGIRNLRIYKDPALHPAMKRIAGWGDALGTPLAMEREMAAPRMKLSGWRLTEKYLIRTGLLSFEAFRLKDLLWAYGRVTKQRINFIPAGKSYAAEMHFADGATVVGGARKKVEQMLLFCSESVPWAVFGYSDELKASIQKDPAGFIAFVEQRKAEGAN